MAGLAAYPGSPQECGRCGRRLSQRSAKGIGCPFCSDLGPQLAPEPLQPKHGKTHCLVSATGLNTLLPGSGGHSGQITLHRIDGDCPALSVGEAHYTSVEAVEAETEDRSLSVSACGFCGRGLA